jgi:hypothetical protein
VSWFVATLIFPPSVFSQAVSDPVEYLSPKSGSALVSLHTSILIRTANAVDAALVDDASHVLVVGSTSGKHTGVLTLSDDGRTLVFEPSKGFAPGETVTVKWLQERSLKTSKESSLLQYQFSTSSLSSEMQKEFLNNLRSPEFPHSSRGTDLISRQSTHLGKSATDSLPPSFPARTIISSGATAPGLLFLASFKIAEASDHLFFVSLVPSDKQYLMILDNSGRPMFYKEMESMSTDFKLQPNGSLTYYDNADDAFYELDCNYRVIDSFRAGNGYPTDLHDLVVLPNGHALMLAHDPEIVDMSKIVPGGNPYATVIGAVIQELDQNKKVIFQWRSLDHFKVTDATMEDMTAATIDAVHPNTIELDNDGNILLSSRHLDEITKIDRRTGDVLWRWGGKNNQFTFTNDTIGFSHQHSIRRTPTGTLLLFDNGNFRTTMGSRALEYSLDEYAKTATAVWQFRHSPDIKAIAMGSVQRLSNGNTLIGWGTGRPALTEVRPDKSIALEIGLPDSIASYRAFRYPWQQSGGVSVVCGATDVPQMYSLAQNYPNPFNPTTQIRFSLPQATTVTVAVFDIRGRAVTTLVEGYRQAGTYSVQFNASRLASGVYLCRLSTPEKSFTRIMTLIK